MSYLTPLASEQITRLIRVIINRYHTTRMAGDDVVLHILASETVQHAIAALAAPAPSCAPGEVERIAAIARDLIPSYEDRAGGYDKTLEVLRHVAALSPQGLDAKS